MPLQQPTDQNKQRRIQPHWVGIMAAVGLLLLSVFGLFFVQKPLQQTQEVRPDASVNDGSVFVTTQPNSSITVNQPAVIRLAVDTKSIATTGVQLVFNIHSTAGFQDMTAQVLTSSGLQSAYLELEQTADGALIGVIALPPGGQQFSTNTPTVFLELTFTPTSVGTLTLNFDDERSIVTKHGSNPPEDVLNNIATTSYTVTGIAVTPTPSATPRVTPSPTPSASPNISCNKSCSSNDNCPVNYRCYSLGNESRCRLVTNPTSTTCQNAPDNGLNRRCNEYCADSRECAAGFSCWQNRCRNPENIDSTSCAALTQTQRTRAIASCNQSCTVNGDCATNLRCHSGRCRLASNPSSLSCSASTTPKVSDSYAGPTKGAADNSATSSGTIKPSPISSPVTMLPTNEAVVTTEPTVETAQDTLLSLIMNAEYSLPLKVLISGFALLVIGLIAGGFLSRRRRRFADQITKPSAPKSQPTVPTPQLPPTPVVPPVLARTERATLQSAFVGNRPAAPVQQHVAPSATQQVEVQLTPPPPRGAGAPQGSMLDRIHKKGVVVPTTDHEHDGIG